MIAFVLLWWLVGMYSYATGQHLRNQVAMRSWKTRHIIKMPIIGIGGVIVLFWCALIVSNYNKNH